MAKLTRFRTDQNAELKGTWIPIGDGAELLIARLGNKDYLEFMQKNAKHLRPALRSGIATSNTELEELVRKAVARHVLLGWKNVEDEDGHPLAYSVSTAEKLLVDLPDFYKLVLEEAQNAENFRQQTIEESRGNS